MSYPASFHFPEISDYRRDKLMAHAEAALEAQEHLMAQGGPHAVMLAHSVHTTKDGAPLDSVQQGFIADWHYPKGDRIDFQGGSQYFYHCHREDFETQEHGHFHCFIRRSGWPKSWRLENIPEKDKYLDNPMTHIGCIALDRYGQPIRLFMVNRHVSRESWFSADKMQRLVKKFDLAHVSATRPKTGDQPEIWRVMDQWVQHLIHLFSPQLCWLYEQRDQAMQQLMAEAKEGENPYLNPDIEELASLDVSLPQQIAWLTGQDVQNLAA